MSYQRKVYHLTWPVEHRLHGLEMTTKGLSVRQLRTISTIRATGNEAKDVEKLDPLIDIFVSALVEWNYEDDDGNLVARDHDEIESKVDAIDLLEIINTWAEEVSSIATPLPENSNSGESFPEGAIPMEVLSPNPMN